MNSEKTHQALIMWGANKNQIAKILPSAMDEQEALQREQHILAIEECLQLLFRQPEACKTFMNSASKSVFFAGRKPLEVIASGSLDDLAEAHRIIRSMLCI